MCSGVSCTAVDHSLCWPQAASLQAQSRSCTVAVNFSMTAYLSSILDGDVDLPALKQWLAGHIALPPPPSHMTSPYSPSSAGHWPNISAEYFRVLLLNHVKEEVEMVFLASEKHASDMHAKHVQPTNETNKRATRAWLVGSKPLAPPGSVNDNTFPALSVQSGKVS